MTKRFSMLLGLDAFAAIVVACVFIAICPPHVPVFVAKEVFGLSASVLSIVFSVFTASLAVIIASPDDKFVMFLDAEGLYEDILWGFQLTLGALFLALVYSIVAFSWSAFQQGGGTTFQNRWGIIIGVVLLAYALGATVSSAASAIGYARLRTKFLRLVSPEATH